MQGYKREISIFDLIGELRKKLIIIIIVALVFSMGAYASTFNHDSYQATATIYIETNAVDGSVPKETNTVPLDYIELIKSKTVIERAIEKANVDLNYEQVISMLSVSNTERTYVLNINVNHEDAEIAALLANVISEEAEDILNDISEVYQLKIIGKASIPKNTMSANGLTKKMIIAFVLGAFIASGVIICRMLFKNGIVSKEDAEAYLETKVIAEYISRHTTELRKNKLFNYIYNSINIICRKEFKCLLVVGVTQNEKTNEIATGLTNILKIKGKKTFKLDVNNDSLGRLDYSNCVSELLEKNDSVIINMSSIESVLEASEAINNCDGAILIVRKNFTNRLAIKTLKEQLFLMNCKIIGVVLTD